MSPLITLALPCFDAEDTIERAVAAAMAQTWAEREIVIVDDCSSDRSGSILTSLAETHRDIRIIRLTRNVGVAAVMNRLLEEARGELIAFMSDDDESVPERVARQHDRIVTYQAEHSDALVFCYSDRVIVQPGERSPSSERHGIGRRHPEPSGPVAADYALGLLKDDGRHHWGAFGTGTLMARTAALRRLGGFDSQFRRDSDTDIVVRAALAGAHFISVASPLITQHVTTSADKGADVEHHYRLLLMRKHRSYLRARNAYVGARCNAYARFCREKGLRRWRVWYLAALVFFPLDVSRERLRRSSVLGRLKPLLLAMRG